MTSDIIAIPIVAGAFYNFPNTQLSNHAAYNIICNSDSTASRIAACGGTKSATIVRQIRIWYNNASENTSEINFGGDSQLVARADAKVQLKSGEWRDRKHPFISLTNLVCVYRHMYWIDKVQLSRYKLCGLVGRTHLSAASLRYQTRSW
jgi:hypothetical protein